VLSFHLRYDDVQAQLMTAPPFCVSLVMCFVIGWLSDRIRSCSGLLAGLTCIAIVGDLILVLLPIENGHGRYAGVFLVQLGILPCITLAVGNIINNCCGDIKKGVAIGIYLSTGSTMGVATGYLFPETDEPKFTTGFWVLFALTCYVATAALFVTIMNKRENARRDTLHGKKPTDRVVDFDEDGLMERHPFWRYYL
jgi:nitrate/nitrite transporter NarK